MSLSAQDINSQLLMLPTQEQLKVFNFLKNQLQSFLAKEQTQEIEKDDFSMFSGILKDSPNFNGDPVEIQRRMRDEWN
jgi:hypothetical protein